MRLIPYTSCNCSCNSGTSGQCSQGIEAILSRILFAIQNCKSSGGSGGGNVNLTGINGVTPSTGNGVTNTGTLRVTVSSDSTGTVAVTQSGSWSLAANQSVNVAQIAGTATSVNAGNVDAGTQRVTLANNTSVALTENATPGNSPVRAEDSAFIASQYVMLGGAQRQDVLSNDTSTDGDIAPIKGTSTGALWTKETRAATGTVTSVNDTASSTTLLAANANRLGVSIVNTSTVNLYIKAGATASLSSFTVFLAPSAYWESPFNYTGILDGIWASDPNTGAAVITEFT
jgi:hypothetical protein